MTNVLLKNDRCRRRTQSSAQHAHVATLPDLPHVRRQMAQDRLREQQNVHPLIVVMVHALRIAERAAAADAMRRKVDARATAGGARLNGVGAIDPAPVVVERFVRVRAVRAQAVHRLAEELDGRDHGGEDEQHDERELGVQLEHIVVDVHVFGAQQAAEGAQDAQHGGHASERGAEACCFFLASQSAAGAEQSRTW